VKLGRNKMAFFLPILGSLACGLALFGSYLGLTAFSAFTCIVITSIALVCGIIFASAIVGINCLICAIAGSITELFAVW
jgi:hypothetical protein